MSDSKWTPRAIRRLLNTSGAALELNKTIQEVYKSLDFYEQEQVKMVGRIIDANLKKLYGKKAGKYSMGELSFAELGIRLAILMMEWGWEAETLEFYIKIKND